MFIDSSNDEGLDDLRLPNSILSTLPSRSLPIPQLLGWDLPPHTNAVIDGDLQPSQYFSSVEPCHDVEDILLAVAVPPRRLVNNLNAAVGQAILEGHKSIFAPANPQMNLPFRALTYWTYLLDASEAQKIWRDVMRWVENTHDSVMQLTVHGILATLPWHGQLKGFGIRVGDVAQLLSNQYLEAKIIDALIAVLTLRLRRAGGTLSENTLLLDTTFGSFLQMLHPIVNGIADGPIKESNTEDKTDGVNCGIIAINAIAHNIFGDPLWTTKSAKTLRMKAFCDIVKNDPWMKRSSPRIDVHDLDLTDGAQNVIAAGFAIDEERFRVASDDVQPHIPNPIPAPGLAAERDIDVEMGELNPTEPGSLKRRAEEPLEEQESRCGKAAKTRPVTVVTPAIFLRKAISIPLPNSVDPKRKKKASASAPGKKTKPAPAITNSSSIVGISLAATKARELRDEVKSGTFQASDTKTANFRRKITSEWDPNAQFEETCKRVQCSTCSSWVEMKEPYNIARFKDHCNKTMQGCTRAAPLAPEPVKKPKTTMDRFLTAALPVKSVNAKPKVSKVPKTVNGPCPRLSIAYNSLCGVYLERSGAVGGGARALGKYVKDIFGDKTTAELTKTEKELAYAAQHHNHTWRNDFTPGIMASFAPCTSCLLLFTSKSYQAVINKPLPENGNFKFTPKRSQNEHLGMQFARYKGLEQLFAEDNEYSIELRYVKHVLNGDFKDDSIFRGIVETKVLAKAREVKGHGMQNFKHNEDLDALASIIHAICPRAYRELEKHLVLRTERSISHKISSAPRFPIGIAPATYQYAIQYCQDYHYPLGAALSLSVDDTKVHAALRPLYDGPLGKWFIVGTTGKATEVPNADMVNATLDEVKRMGELAAKVRLWVLQIPLPEVPPLAIAVMPIAANVRGVQLSEWHLELMKGLISRGFRITGSGGDGAAVERQCQKLTAAASKRVEYRIQHPDSLADQNESASREDVYPALPPPVNVTFWNLDGNIWAEFQDAKHGRKTFRNNASTGARGLILGNHVVFFQQIYDLAMQSDSPMYRRDVKENRDKMDDRAAARLFSADTLEQASRDPERHLGLVIYLLVFGDFIDAYQSRSLSHYDRARIVLRTHLFLRTWKLFLAKAGYPEARHFISKEAFAISEILINGLLALLFIHRDHLGDHPTPLLPWLYASEPNEHCFAAMRDISADFTFQEALLLIPKLRVKMQSAVRQTLNPAEYKKVASGYCHTYFTGDGVDYANLSRYPTDIELSAAYQAAAEENDCLWTLLGTHPCQLQQSPTAFTLPHPNPDLRFQYLYVDEADILGAPEVFEPSPAEQLQQYIDSLQSSVGLTRAQDQQLDAYAMAAVALSIDELQRIEDMPDSDPTRYQEIQRDIMTALATQPTAFIAVLQGLADASAHLEARNTQTSRTIVDVSASDLSPFVEC
ncbi:hypothetical protein GGX14DRAFT_559755 [Mycena pura]|uniref:Ubiquitin-like protease family profile domain-containing protein n=1 Tax=Mycena pura TaxID=153505 RepID=A0AAD6VTQ2_9AGAR|nr:hypothetical protein GGX14DRAFT_559755 [Mycena pura]